MSRTNRVRSSESSLEVGEGAGKVTVVREAIKIPYKPEHVTLEQINAAVRKLELSRLTLLFKRDPPLYQWCFFIIEDKIVFINCPFYSAYQPILYAVTFAIRDADFVPRSALETNNTAEERLAKIVAIIGECRYSIHDISRVELPSGDPTKLPRFNMPFECGICFGAIHFGDKGRKKKEMLVMDGVKFRLQKTMSDIARMAGVKAKTVSRKINQEHKDNKETSKRDN